MKCGHDCEQAATDCLRWQSSAMAAPAFWYDCWKHADDDERYFATQQHRVEYSRRKL